MSAGKLEKLISMKKTELKELAQKLKLGFSARESKEQLVKLISSALEKKGSQKKREKKTNMTANIEQVDKKAELARMKKDELLTKVKELGGKAAPSMTKTDLIDVIEKLEARAEAMSKAAPASAKFKRVTEEIRPRDEAITEAPTAPVSKIAPDFKHEAQSARYAAVNEKVEPQHKVTPQFSEHQDEGLPFPQWIGQSIIYLLPRDDQWIFATWEIDWETRRNLVGDKKTATPVIRLYNFGSEADPREEPTFTQIVINEDADNWFIDTGFENHVFEAEIGYLIEGEFKPIARSNRIVTARASVSNDMRAFFVSISPDIPLVELRRRLKALGINPKRLAFELHRLDMGAKPPEGYPGMEAASAAIAERVRQSMETTTFMGSESVTVRQAVPVEKLPPVNADSETMIKKNKKGGSR